MNLTSSPVETTLDGFLEVISPGDTSAVPLWRRKTGSGTSPGFPIPAARLKDHGAAMFYGTSAMTPVDGKLYNRQSQFQSLNVIVLDDLGTKVKMADVPLELREGATYVIESSPGNFQYGYVLNEPVTDLEAAKMLVHTIYRSGYTDEGGGLVNKAVRLPFGVNGKPGPHMDFSVQLHRASETFWTPEQLLKAVGSDLDWTEVLKDAVAARRNSRELVATDWAPVRAQASTAEGYVDPVLEWLYATDRIVTETAQWITVTCPWSAEHTDTGTTAGYSPIGRGNPDFVGRRGFHCFHQHCTGNKISEFLNWVATEGGPEAGVSDMAWELVSEWAFDSDNNAAQHLQSARSIQMSAFRTYHPKKIRVPDAEKEGKTKKIAEVEIWVNAPNRVTLHGKTYDPEHPLRIVMSPEGPKLNTFKPPEWPGKSENYADNVATFREFIDYLIPDLEEQTYFLDWLAAKRQNFAFRGAGIVMTTPAFGVGRGTLGRIITELFNGQNVNNMSFDKLVGANTFNEWQEKLFLLCDETRDQGPTSLYKAYERLKDLIDVHVKDVIVNPKYERTRNARCCTSFLLFSNHSDGIAVAEGDRRLYVISNPGEPASPEYFMGLNEWIDANAWQADVWAYLRDREGDMDKLLAPAPITFAKSEMMEQGKSDEQRVAEFMLKRCREAFGFVIPAKLQPIMDAVAEHMSAGHPKRLRAQMQRLMRNETAAYPGIDNRLLLGTARERVRAFRENNNRDNWVNKFPVTCTEYFTGPGAANLLQMERDTIEFIKEESM